MGAVVHIDGHQRLRSLRKRIGKADDALVRQFNMILRFPKESKERALAVSLMRVMLETYDVLENREKQIEHEIRSDRDSRYLGRQLF